MARHSVVERPERQRDAAAKRIEWRVRAALEQAESVIGAVEEAGAWTAESK